MKRTVIKSGIKKPSPGIKKENVSKEDEKKKSLKQIDSKNKN